MGSLSAPPPLTPHLKGPAVDPALLARTTLFENLTGEELARISELCREERFRAGETIFREGDEGHRLYVVVEGKARVGQSVAGAGEEALAVLGPGDCFGEMVLFGAAVRSADVTAHEDVTCAVLERTPFEAFLEEHPEVGNKVLKAVVRILSDRLRHMNEQIRALFAMSGF